jgi:phospholipase D1/2
MSAVRSVGLADAAARAWHAAREPDRMLLRPGRNVWRVERAGRAAVLVDAAAFFAAARAAFLKAERSILIIGWDIDSRTQLVGDSGRPNDGFPAGFADFLAKLVEARPDLRVDLLLWDYSLLYAGERELLPRLSLDWTTPERIRLCLDDTVPFGSSQHQKIVVVDDTLAFSGGLDLTIRRWDAIPAVPRRAVDGRRPGRPRARAARTPALVPRIRWRTGPGGRG